MSVKCCHLIPFIISLINSGLEIISSVTFSETIDNAGRDIVPIFFSLNKVAVA